MEIWIKIIKNRVSEKYKDSVVRTSFLCLNNSKKVTVAKIEQTRNKIEDVVEL